MKICKIVVVVFPSIIDCFQHCIIIDVIAALSFHWLVIVGPRGQTAPTDYGSRHCIIGE